MRSQSKRIPTGPLHKVYNVAMACVLPLVSAGLPCFARGRRRLAERYGVWGELPHTPWWFHAASVGEVQGVLPLIKRVRSVGSAERVLLTSTSPTGLDRAGSAVDSARLVPIDVPWLVKSALRSAHFDRFVLTETELWPNLMHAVLETGKPCHIINGRISDYTMAWYERLSGIFAPLLRRFSSISVPDEGQRDRFSALGVDRSKVFVTGHTKYDSAPAFLGDSARHTARELFFPGISPETPLITLGSIRGGEERFWFEAIKRVWKQGIPLHVIVAPRHAERFEFFWSAMAGLSNRVARWSERGTRSARECDALLLDTMGVLEQAYCASDYAFVGATMVDIGGHNPFEPAMYGVPIAVGQYTSVIEEPVAELEKARAARRIRSEGDIYALLEELVRDPQAARKSGEAAKRVWASHQGAVERVMQVISQSEVA
jgi:3-deoxy-D-manno-octulosonic-acid transferase